MYRFAFRCSVVLRQMPLPQQDKFKPKQTDISEYLNKETQRRKQMMEDISSKFEVVMEERKGGGRAIGIDLGTTNSCLCYIDPTTKRPKIIPSPTGSWVFPTAVTFDKNHQARMFGEEARACVRTSASATLCSGKRLLGRGFGELGKVQSDLHKTNVISVNEHGEVVVEVLGRNYTVVHIIAMFLRYLKKEAERFLKEPVDMAVVSVPAYFTPQQKVATEDAALCAGFDVLEIIDEPSAACLTDTVLRSLKRPHSQSKGVEAEGSAPSSSLFDEKSPSLVRSLVFDLGGGTLDCAIMEHNTRKHRFKLVATHGDPLLGGNDWDTVIAHHFAREFEQKWRIPIEEEGGNVGQGVSAYRNLQLEAEKAKVHFTHSTETYHGYNRVFHFSSVLRDLIPLEAVLTHEQYVEMTRPLRVRCLECVQTLLDHTNLEVEDIDRVLLVGAMTRDPPLRHMLMEYLGKEIVSEECCPADYAVAIGAGIRSGMLQGMFPELSASTQFVSGTVQSMREGGVLRRAWRRARSLTMSGNPNAIGQRWRGRAHGLSDDEIARYAKELVEFEAASERRELLEQADSDANSLMRRVVEDSTRKQGVQERRLVQLSEQVKFWQYMVRNFHDHEEDLARTMKELQRALDELDGIVPDDEKGPGSDPLLRSDGTIDFAEVSKHKNASSTTSGPVLLTEAEKKRIAREAEEARTGESHFTLSGSSESPSGGSSGAAEPVTPAPKVLRRKAPLPAASAEAQEIIEVGHPALRYSNAQMTESTRISFLEEQVTERAWREPPVPPGESGSWADVKAALDSGDEVGSPLPLRDLTRQMTMEEMLAWLQEEFPIDDPVSEEHANKLTDDQNLQTMTIRSGCVDMAALAAALDAEEVDAEGDAKSQRAASRTEAEEASEVMGH